MSDLRQFGASLGDAVVQERVRARRRQRLGASAAGALAVGALVIGLNLDRTPTSEPVEASESSPSLDVELSTPEQTRAPSSVLDVSPPSSVDPEADDQSLSTSTSLADDQSLSTSTSLAEDVPPSVAPVDDEPACDGSSTTYLAKDGRYPGGNDVLTLGPLSITAQDSAGDEADVTRHGYYGLAVDGGRYDSQIDFDPTGGGSESLVVSLPANTCRLTITVTMLGIDDGLVETGAWTALDEDGNVVAAGTFAAEAGDELERRYMFALDLPPNTSAVVLNATGYDHGRASAAGGNNSDFAVVAFEVLGQAER